MLAVFSCISQEHDLWLVALAALVCVAGSVTALRFHRRTAQTVGNRRLMWGAATGFVAGSAVWATHFVAMLAYSFELPVRYDINITLASLAAGIVGLGAGFAIAARTPRLWSALAGGVVAGLGIVSLHFIGIGAVRSAFHLEWNIPYVAGSVICAIAGAAGALFAAQRLEGLKGWIVPPVLLVLGIVGLHFTGMTALTLIPDLTAPAVFEEIGPGTLATLVAGVALVIISAAGAMAVVEARTRKVGLRNIEGAFQGASSGMALFDASDRLVLWNEAYARIVVPLGVKPAVGASRKSLSMGTAMESRSDEAAGLLRAGKVFSAEGRTPDGAWLRIEMRRLDDGGAVTVLSDITDLKNVADAMAEARDRAEAASQAKSDFLANMSHEIRTPLNGVLGMAQVMAGGELSTPQRERLQVIQDSGEALLSILNSILDLSKVQAGKMELEDAPFDVRDFTAATASAFEGAASAKGLALSVDVATGTPAGWRGDALRLRQVISNLVGNAVKFTPHGSVALEVSGDAGGLTFKVRDTGIGIARDEVPRLFDKFSQGDSTTTRRYGGTGLGLSICQELVALMGGRITVESAMGQGACFTVFVPLSPITLDIETADAIQAEAPEEATLTILVAEDNETNQLVVRSLLEPLGAAVVMVGNGQLAAEAFQAQAFDIVLMDIQMPEMNGIEAARKIRAFESAQGRERTPILALTANVMTHQIEEYLAAGMDGCVAKPIDLGRLYAAIGEALDGSGAGEAAEAA